MDDNGHSLARFVLEEPSLTVGKSAESRNPSHFAQCQVSQRHAQGRLQLGSAAQLQHHHVSLARRHSLVSVMHGIWCSGGGHSVIRVDVSADDGKTWTVAELSSVPAKRSRCTFQPACLYANALHWSAIVRGRLRDAWVAGQPEEPVIQRALAGDASPMASLHVD